MKQYKDENELAAAFLRVMQKLYILRNLRDVPSDLTLKRILASMMSAQSLAILNPEEQALIVGCSRHAGLYEQVLFSGIPYIEHTAYGRLNPYDRIFLRVLKLVSDNRGSHPEGGYRVTDSEEWRAVLKQHSRRVLAWALRSLNLADHPVFTPIPLEVETVIDSLKRYRRSLVTGRPEYADVFKRWFGDLQTVRYILTSKLNGVGVPHQLLSNLSPEGEDLYEFLYCLVLRQSNRLSERYLENFSAPRIEIARQNLLWILTQKNVLDDLANPPYGVSPAQVIEQLYSADARGLDQKAVDYLNERREKFALYNKILEQRDLEDFVSAFSALPPEDQAFMSVLSGIDKFYTEHGSRSLASDSWFSPDFYDRTEFQSNDLTRRSDRFYSDLGHESDDHAERAELRQALKREAAERHSLPHPESRGSGGAGTGDAES